MVGVAGFEPSGLSKNQAQNSDNSPDGAHIEAQEEPPDPLPYLHELIELWPDLSENIKRAIILIARDGGLRHG